MGEEGDTASPDSKPPPEPQRSVHSEPEEPGRGGVPAPDEGDDSPQRPARD